MISTMCIWKNSRKDSWSTGTEMMALEDTKNQQTDKKDRQEKKQTIGKVDEAFKVLFTT